MNPDLDPIWPFPGQTFVVEITTESSWMSDAWAGLARYWKSASGEIKSTALEIVVPAEGLQRLIFDIEVTKNSPINSESTAIDISDDIDNFTQWLRDTGVQVADVVVSAAGKIDQHSKMVADDINQQLKDGFGLSTIEKTAGKVASGVQSFAMYAAVAVVGLIFLVLRD